jgi:hypothetical protein
LLAYPHRVRETGHGFLWMMGRVFGWPVRAILNRGRRIPPGAVQQPAE